MWEGNEVTQLNAPQAPQPVRSTYPLSPYQAKRLVGVLAVSEWPVRYAGMVIAAVQRKRHHYDEWTFIHNSGEIDTANQAFRYRAVVQCPNAQPTPPG